MGWGHMVNLVALPVSEGGEGEGGGETRKYLVDVGFGANGPVVPIPLVSGVEIPSPIGTTRFKLEYKALEQHTDRSQRMWVYSYRESDEKEWLDAYAFTELEFFAEDYEVMSLATSTLRQSFFVQSLFCVRMVLDTEQGGKGGPVGWLVLHGDKVTRRIGATTEVLEELKTEGQRVVALQRWFGIQLSEAEKCGIVDLPTEIRGWKLG
ncbi:hypothetical protein B0T16DRAFT_421250 [Cercophora newfieldiana]|uniref:Arylamine N-acetyltransferase n=1 Tax=Cercophora newfieldiana TaxID=92897 RepID=A0AA39XRR9_9PEZI|nr:hypothetical protein B0T16DRAFT_421250 [Cercophora newfieldiana]